MQRPTVNDDIFQTHCDRMKASIAQLGKANANHPEGDT